MSEKCLLDQWRDMAYDRNLPKDQLEKFWGTYFTIEREIYEQLLENPDEEVKGTVKELAEKYGQDVMTMVGFLDGINDSLKTANPIETMEEDTVVSLAFDKELLYKNMIDAKLTGCMDSHSGIRSLMQRQRNVCIVSRNSPVQFARRKRSEEMIHVRAEVERNINSAVERTHKNQITGGMY